MHVTNFTILPVRNVGFSGVKCVHIVVQPSLPSISRTVSENKL